MSSRVSILLAISALVSAASLTEIAPSANRPVQADPCSMSDSVRTTRAFERLNRILTDTAIYYASLRTQAGLEAANPREVVTITDTVACRRAVNAMYSYYDTTSDSAEVRSVNSGLLLRASVNRLILVVALSNPWSGSQWIVLDSSYTMIRHTL